MDMLSVIEVKKLNQRPLTREEITFFADAAAQRAMKGDGTGVQYAADDSQLAAMLMAIRLNGMTNQETVDLTLAMARSGDMANLSELHGVPVDKHSTGGVGDTTTLIVAPLVAACGVPVAKMSGRGLGHTGGTLDKLESIPGFRVELRMADFVAQVQRIGLAVIGQTGNLAPADKTLYRLRDITSTVDSLPLVASSIMSKKLASGAQAIVLDVKTGSGAVMHTLEESVKLAETMVHIGTKANRRMVALVTDMDEPLGSHIGNALEVKEAIDVLSGRVTGPLMEVSLALGVQMLLAAGAAQTAGEAEKKLTDALHSGRGLEKLREMVIAQHGDPRVCDDVSLLPQASVIAEVPVPKAGTVQRMDAMRLGNLAQRLGAGRRKESDVIDPGVGIVLHRRVGDAIGAGESLATLHCKTESDAAAAKAELLAAVPVGPEAVSPTQYVYARIDQSGITRY